jgi:tRNA threonylcarbamoyladenosine biosynthesis protein TsaB
MKVLGLDTSTLTAGVALVDDRTVVAEARHDASHRTNDLLVTIDEVCRRAGVGPTELDAVAIGAGPGSFTGLRIGMATAKGIAFAAARPLWAVSSLAALAHDARAELAQQRGRELQAVIVAVLDARRGEVFAGCYRADHTLLADERVLAPGELASWVTSLAGDALVWYAGDAITAHADVLARLADRWLAARTPSGTAVARLALGGARIDVVTSGAPTYIRPSEAEVKYPDGVPGALRRDR